MDDLWAALGLVLVIEGAIYALFPQAMIDMMRRLPEISPRSIRLAGIVAVALGWMVVRFIRS
ncbi:hypothetical protein Ga0123462_1215 [Mariprofundus ferrinatatus]|uniref:DUF2065 domain-containing protein n=1 Tax=Mariprofundus ferrinatatus TaxID=1921087 RepID=A0A2K8L747_9PROT|nr:DUF2065 domain-containing protein [Mariprofundus ferrinatatus]ATX82079.1 hypothetical protein Ga0123462_1215 [Mariprofundus ferrinatatus]